MIKFVGMRAKEVLMTAIDSILAKVASKLFFDNRTIFSLLARKR